MHSICAGVRGPLVGVSSIIPPHGAQGLNTGHHTWWQAPSSVEPARWPGMVPTILTHAPQLEKFPSLRKDGGSEVFGKIISSLKHAMIPGGVK